MWSRFQNKFGSPYESDLNSEPLLKRKNLHDPLIAIRTGPHSGLSCSKAGRPQTNRPISVVVEGGHK
jgi:hypothetical protein